VESFVQEPRFAGRCYQAAGWVWVGLTTGRTRNDDGLNRTFATGGVRSSKPLENAGLAGKVCTKNRR